MDWSLKPSELAIYHPKHYRAKKLLAKQIPVVLVSRCFNGIAEPVYGYSGGGKELQEMGVIFCNSINSQKARIKLLIAKNRRLPLVELHDFMEN